MNMIKNTKTRLKYGWKVFLCLFVFYFGSIYGVKAQYFMLDYLEEDESELIGRPQIEGLDVPSTPQLGITIDQYAPVGSGIAVLAALGGAYLLGKRKKD